MSNSESFDDKSEQLPRDLMEKPCRVGVFHVKTPTSPRSGRNNCYICLTATGVNSGRSQDRRQKGGPSGVHVT